MAYFNNINIKNPLGGVTLPKLNQTGVKAKSAEDNIKGPPITLPKNQARPLTKTTGTQAGDIAAGYIKGGNLNQSNPTSSVSPSATIPATTMTSSNPVGYTPNTGLYGQLITGLANTATQPNQAYQTALPAYSQAVQNLAGFNQQLAQKYGAIENTPIPLEFQQGREQVLARQAASQQEALQQAINQQQEALGLGLQQQQLQQSGLQGAAGLAAPQPYSITTTPFLPASNQFGQMAGGQAGAFGAGQIQGNVALGQQYSQTLAPAYQAAGAVKKGLDNWLESNPSINPSDVNVANELKAWLSGQQFSDPRYPQLSQFLNEFLNTLTPIIGSPGEVTNYKQAIVSSLLNPTASGASLKQQADSLYQLAGQKLEAIKSSGTNQPAGGTVNAGGFNFVQDAQGRWVPA